MWLASGQLGNQGRQDVDPIFTWVRLAQRVPVRMEIDRLPPDVVLSAGMTASVSVTEQKPANLVRVSAKP